MKHIEIKIGQTTVKLTSGEFCEMLNCTEKMLSWGVGGSYGNGTDVTKKKEMKTAERAVEKINRALLKK